MNLWRTFSFLKTGSRDEPIQVQEMNLSGSRDEPVIKVK